MCSNNKFSIIIPVYNVESYITNTLKSLEIQLFKDFEVIIVNDGSTDNSLNIVNSYTNTTALNIKIITQENRGVSAARNLGLKNSNGEYILFLDGDDYLSEDALSLFYDSITQNIDCDIIFGRYQRVSKDAKIIDSYDRFLSYNDVYGGKELLNLFLNDNEILWTGCVIYNRFFIIDNKLTFPVGLAYAEDQCFYFKALFFARKVFFIKKVIAFYLFRENSVVNLIHPKKVRGDIVAYLHLLRFCKSRDNDLYAYIKNIKLPKQIFDVLHLLSSLGYDEEFKRFTKRKTIRKYLFINLLNKSISLKKKIIIINMFTVPYIYKIIKIVKSKWNGYVS